MSRKALWCLFFWGSLLPLHAAVAQGQPSGRSGLADLGLVNPMQQLRQQLSSSGLRTGGLLALEGTLDPAAYLVGPGDLFSFSTGGALPIQLEAQVTAAGHLVIPGVGSIEAAGLPLQTVEARAEAAMRTQYRNVPVEASLAQPRQFFVHVSGAVPAPGRYLTMPVARVSDVLEEVYAANAIEIQYLQATAQLPPTVEKPERPKASASAERPELNDAFQPSLRSVLLVRNGVERSLDLFRYFTVGDTAHNPYMLDGDVIKVPSFHAERDAILVTGEVPYPGRFAYRAGDTVQDLLLLAAGPEGSSRLGEVRLIQRRPDGTTETQRFDAQALKSRPAVPVQPGDRLDVPPVERPTAAIYGLVEYPGTYPIQPGETTLQALIEMAGGLKPDANVSAAYIERRKSNYFKGDGRISDLDFFERFYLRRELSQNRVVLDLATALQEGGRDFVLFDGDAVAFPRDESTVFVTGNVPQPGFVPFVPGRPAEYYVQAAGGAGPNTTGIYVFDPGTGGQRLGGDATVASGNTIFVNREIVPDNPELAQLYLTEQASRRQTRILTTQTIITGVTAITGIITTIVAIMSL